MLLSLQQGACQNLGQWDPSWQSISLSCRCQQTCFLKVCENLRLWPCIRTGHLHNMWYPPPTLRTPKEEDPITMSGSAAQLPQSHLLWCAILDSHLCHVCSYVQSHVQLCAAMCEERVLAELPQILAIPDIMLLLCNMAWNFLDFQEGTIFQRSWSQPDSCSDLPVQILSSALE